MSPLAFDKQGKPFTWHAQTAKLRVRLFRTPSSRGTCSQVLDGAGSPLFVDANIDYAEFCRVVGKVPGLYRFDQCDEDGVEIKDAPPGYMSIENLRNAGGASSDDTHDGQVSALAIIDRLMATQERLVATQAEVMKQMASQHAAMLAAGAEVMRAPYRAAPAAELRNADASDDNDSDDDENDDDNDGEHLDESNPWNPMLRMLEPHLPQLGAFLYQKFVEFVQRKPSAPVATPPAATPTPMPAPVAATVVTTAPQTAGEPVDVVAGFEPEDDFEAEDVELDASQIANAAPVPPVAAPANDTTTNAATATAMAPVPTPEQLAHLCTIRERLSPKERAIAENAMARMEPAMLTHWLTELSAMSVDEATTTIRTMVAQLAMARGKDRR